MSNGSGWGMNKKILLISPFFFPEQISTGRYNSHLVHALINAGFMVDVIVSHPIYPDWRPVTSTDQMPGVRIVRGGASVIYPKSSILRRLVLESWFAFHVFRASIAMRNNYDLVLFVFPPVLFSCLPKWVFGSGKRVGIIHDLQGIMVNTRRNLIRTIVSKIVHYLEAKAFNRCDWLVSLSSSMKNVLIYDYKMSEAKIFVSYPFPSISGVITNDLAGMFQSECVHIVYSGALGEKQCPDFVFEIYDSICRLDENFVCHFFSRGPIFEKLLAKASSLGMKRIQFHDLVPERNLAELYLRSSVQIIPQAKGTGAGAFPSKLPNLLMAGVPVFAICADDSELAKVVAESGGGKSNGSQSANDIACEIIEFSRSSNSGNAVERKNNVSRFLNEKCNIVPLIERLTASACIKDA